MSLPAGVQVGFHVCLGIALKVSALGSELQVFGPPGRVLESYLNPRSLPHSRYIL